MATDNRFRLPTDLVTKLEARKGDEDWKEFAIKMIEQGLEGATVIALDDSVKQPFFKHLSGGKGKDYQSDLKSLELTEQELIDMAIEKSGKRYEDLLKEALITYAKEQITFAARREHIDETSNGTPETRLNKAFAELTEMCFEGTYRPRGGKLNLSAVAQRAVVNYGTAKKWAQRYQPELLE